jgi:hypothetical protein
MRRFLNPKNDLTFRHLFGLEKNKGTLLAFLNDVFDGVHPKIEDVSFQNLNPYPEIRTFAQRIDIRTHQCCLEQFSHTFLELGKINKTLEESKTMVEKWAYFFKHATKTTEEELEAIARDYPPVWEAYRALERYDYTKGELDEYLRLGRNASAIATSIADTEKN